MEILHFQAEYQDDVVYLLWETGPEVDLLGFYVTRSNEQFGTYSRIGNLIAPTGDAELGAYYDFTDSEIADNTTYWYRLEAVQEGDLRTYSESIRVVTGPAQTPTSTRTSAPVNTPTTTATLSTGGTSPPTRTPTPTATQLATLITATVVEATSLSPTGTTTPEVTEAISPTTTLIPLPEITLQFPTPVTNLDASSEGAAKPQGKSLEEQRGDILRRIGRALFLAFIALIWLVLGVWFYLTSRRVE